MTKKIIMWTLVVAWMGVIFFFSSYNGIDSTSQSKGFLYNTLGKVIDIFDKDITLQEKDLLIEKLDTPIRKVAHGCVYLILAILICLALDNYKIDIKKLLTVAFIICVLYAISDEIHQTFIDGRSGEIKDVFIDSIGVSLGLLLYKKCK